MKVTTDSCLFGSLLPTSSKGGSGWNVLDIGTGTGLLALMFAQKNPDAIIDAIEIDQEAAEQARENVEASPWKGKINIIHANAKSFAFNKKYDLIISNPPFYESEIKPENARRSIAHHSGGLLLEELLSVIKSILKPDGSFSLLLPFKRNTEIKNLLAKYEFDILQMIFVRQSLNHDYFRIIIIGKNKSEKSVKTDFDEISICDEVQQYTAGFMKSLKDYYLHL